MRGCDEVSVTPASVRFRREETERTGTAAPATVLKTQSSHPGASRSVSADAPPCSSTREPGVVDVRAASRNLPLVSVRRRRSSPEDPSPLPLALPLLARLLFPPEQLVRAGARACSSGLRRVRLLLLLL